MMSNMCNKKEVKEATAEAIEEYMTRKNGDGLTVVEHEMKEVLNATISGLILKFGAALIAIIVAGTIAWLEVKHDVTNNTEARTVGDRYTQEEHDAFATVMEAEHINLERRVDGQDARLIRIEDKIDRLLENI